MKTITIIVSKKTYEFLEDLENKEDLDVNHFIHGAIKEKLSACYPNSYQLGKKKRNYWKREESK
jgi:hypothetical protein